MKYFPGTNLKSIVSIAAPASKSYVQRALACFSMCQPGAKMEISTRETNESNDNKNLLAWLERAEIVKPGAIVLIEKANDPLTIIDASFGESGLSTRMMSVILAVKAARNEQETISVSGEGCILGRKFDDVADVISAIGGRLESAETNMLPYKISTTGISTNKFVMPHSIDSSQAISGLMIASAIDSGCVIDRTSVPSTKYVDITASVMREFGIEVIERFDEYVIPGNQTYLAPKSYNAPGDWSGSAFLLAYAAISGASNVVISGLDDETQADAAFIEHAKTIGVNFKHVNTPSANGYVFMHCSSLVPKPNTTPVDISDCPDIAPPLASLAATGRSVHMTGVSRLQNKECDRLEAIIDVMSTFGFDCTHVESSDSLIVSGRSGTCWPTKPSVSSRGDHRIAMLARTMLTRVSPLDGITIDDHECVNKSFKSFYDCVNLIDGETK